MSGARPACGAAVWLRSGAGVPLPGGALGERVADGLCESDGTGLGDSAPVGPSAFPPPPGSVSESVAATTTATPVATTAARRMATQPRQPVLLRLLRVHRADRPRDIHDCLQLRCQ